MNNWQRLEQVIKWTGLSTNAFALGIGLKRSENLYQIKRGSFGISKELARLITVKYPMINRSWLLTGEGSMLLTSGSGTGSDPQSPAPSGSIPYYQADILSLTGLIELQPTSHMILPMFKGATLAASYMGNAMQPSVPNGSTVIVRQASLGAILPGEIYLVSTNDYVILRRIRTIEGDSDRLQLIADNQQQYDSMTIDKSSISTLHLLMGVITNYQV